MIELKIDSIGSSRFSVIFLIAAHFISVFFTLTDLVGDNRHAFRGIFDLCFLVMRFFPHSALIEILVSFFLTQENFSKIAFKVELRFLSHVTRQSPISSHLLSIKPSAVCRKSMQFLSVSPAIPLFHQSKLIDSTIFLQKQNSKWSRWWQINKSTFEAEKVT